MYLPREEKPMKAKLRFTAILLLMAVLLTSCNTAGRPVQNTEALTSDTVTDKPDDPFEELRSSGEEWIIYGLEAYEKGKEPKNLKEFFSDSANLTYLTLYDHFFTYDKKRAVSVAEALFSFIYEEYGIEALTDIEKRCEYKSAYLRSLGLQLEYYQDPAAEALLSSMELSSNDAYKYIFTFDNVTYYFKDFSAGSPSQYHGFLYSSTIGLHEMIDYLKANNLSNGLDTDRDFDFYMIFGDSAYSVTYPNGDMYINDSYSTLHEALHAMGITARDNIWLSEGICNYFGKGLGFNIQIAAANIQIMAMIGQGYYDKAAEEGEVRYVIYKNIYNDYVGRGGKLDSHEAFDFRLFSDANARAELNAGVYATLGEAYEHINETALYSNGTELSYEQCTSLVFYLVDTYGEDKLLEAYRTQDLESAFGKGYEELKADWLAYLYG